VLAVLPAGGGATEYVYWLCCSQAAVRLSRLSRMAVAQAAGTLEPLHEQLALAPSVARALREREEALLTADAIQDDLEKKQRAIAQLEAEGSKARSSMAPGRSGMAVGRLIVLCCSCCPSNAVCPDADSQ
jgi:hypothetical protein